MALADEPGGGPGIAGQAASKCSEGRLRRRLPCGMPSPTDAATPEGEAPKAQRQPEGLSMEPKLKHLELIQGVINRMASNSLRLKEWSVVLVSAILFLATREGSGNVALIGLVPAVVFWGLDAYFLRQERLYRALYDHVRILEPQDIDFSMKTHVFTGRTLRWINSLFSTTLLAFYSAVIAASILASLVI